MKFFFSRQPIQPLKDLSQPLKKLRQTQLWFQIILALIFGVLTGLLLEESTGFVSHTTGITIGKWFALPGNLFLALIQSVVIPLVVSSIIVGLNSSKDIEVLRRIGARIVPYFILTTILACLIGLFFSFTIKPGNFIDQAHITKMMDYNQDLVGAVQIEENSSWENNLPEKIIGVIPQNFSAAVIKQDMLQVVIYSILLGVALLAIPKDRSKTIIGLLSVVQEVSMKVVAWAMMLAPYAVFGLIAQITIKIGLNALISMSAYVGTVLVGLLTLLFVYLAIVFVFTKKNPLEYLKSIRDVMLLAFSTSSSAAVMPLSVKTAEEKLHIDPSISQFVIPLGATINMAGTALYQVTAAIFLSQVFSVSLSMGSLVILIATVVGASIGSPASPGVGIVILATILTGIGIPSSGIALIIGVDRILDMTRTSVNVTGDLVGCSLVQKWLLDDDARIGEKKL